MSKDCGPERCSDGHDIDGLMQEHARKCKGKQHGGSDAAFQLRGGERE